MLNIAYCKKNHSEITIEGDCEQCEFYKHLEGYFGCDWYECIWEIWLEMTKEEYINLVERLKVGL